MKAYDVFGTELDKDGSDLPHFTLSEEDRIERNERDLFTHEGQHNDFWSHISLETRKILAPLLHPAGLGRVIVMAVLSVVMNFMFKLQWPLVRGWRLQVVRQVALQKEVPVPSTRLDQLIKYYRKGLVLLFSRFVYFLPVLFVSLITGSKMLGVAWEVLLWFKDFLLGADDMGLVEFFGKKVLPEVGVEILIQLVVLTLYAVLVWPVYRIIMIKYALGKCRGWDFFSPEQIAESVRIFRRFPAEVYGIYSFVLAIDVFSFLFGITLGIPLFFIMPLISLVFRYWVIGYAYGQLGKLLLSESAFESPNSSHNLILDEQL